VVYEDSSEANQSGTRRTQRINQLVLGGVVRGSDPSLGRLRSSRRVLFVFPYLSQVDETAPKQRARSEETRRRRRKSADRVQKVRKYQDREPIFAQQAGGEKAEEDRIFIVAVIS
jgi:hypothetical protein